MAEHRAGTLVHERYRLERQIGCGGMGAVWEARDLATETRAAVKFMHPAIAADPAMLARFKREARAASAISHPNVVRVLEVLEGDGETILALELLEGEALATRLARSAAIDPVTTCRWLAQVAAGVAAAHAAGIVHRDLKPENVFLCVEGPVKVLDFGIAKLTAVDGDAARTAATKTGVLLGTPAYMAPEQIFGERDLDARVDVWALGVVLYQCLSGTLPTAGDGVGQVLKMILSAPIPRLADVAPGVPADLAAFVDRMLSRDRSARPRSMNDVRAVLERFASGTTSPMEATLPIEAASLSAGRASPAGPLLPDKPAIAVLPFTNMSGDSEQEYFTDGVVEEIITALARLRWLFVIARNSSFTYKGRAVDVRTVGRELGVHYVMEGSVRRGGDRLRITAQLIEAATGAQVWGERYDGTVAEVFELQDRITESVVGAIEPSVRKIEIERARRKPPESLDAHDLYLRALPHLYANAPAENAKGSDLLERALVLDPNHAAAHAHLAWSLEQRFMRGGMRPADRTAALDHARAAVANRDDHQALTIGGFVLVMLGQDWDAGLGALDAGLALNPSSALGYGFSGVARAFHEEFPLALDHLARSLRLSPLDPTRFTPLSGIGLVHFLSGRFAEVLAPIEESIRLNPRFSFTYVLRVASLVRLGRRAEAEAAAARLLEIAPDFTPMSIEMMPCARREVVASIAAPLREIGMLDAPLAGPGRP